MIYERYINQIVNSRELKFKATVHDCCTYQTSYKVHYFHLLGQTDDLALAGNDDSFAKEIYINIAIKLQLLDKTEPLSIYYVFITDYNGVNVRQYIEYI